MVKAQQLHLQGNIIPERGRLIHCPARTFRSSACTLASAVMRACGDPSFERLTPGTAWGAVRVAIGLSVVPL